MLCATFYWNMSNDYRFNPLKRVLAFMAFLLVSFTSYAQTGTIKGTVSSSDGHPVPYVNIFVKKTVKGAVTADDGTYTIRDIKVGTYTLVATFVGLKKQEKTVTIADGETVAADFSLPENARDLSEVIVTAPGTINDKPLTIGKLPVKTMDLPQSVTIIGRDIIEQQQVQSMSDVLKNVNGVYIMGATGGTQEEIAARGYAFNSSNTFKNGVRFNNSITPELSGVESVEVLKGSNAILYGNVTAGGALNIITKKPTFEKGGEVAMRLGSYDLYKPMIDIYGPITNSQTIAYRVNTTYQKARSFRDQVNSERFYINPSFLIKAGRKVDILLEGDYLDDNRTLDYGTGAINYVIADIPRNRFLGASWSYNKVEQTTGRATTTYHINSNWDLRNVTGYSGNKTDLFGTTRPNNSGNFVKADGTWLRGLTRSNIEEDYYSTQFDLTGTLQTGVLKHAVLAGVDADKYDTRTKQFDAYRNPAFNNKNVYDSINLFDLNMYTQRTDIPTIRDTGVVKTKINRYGAYVQDLISVTEQIKLLAGVRYSYIVQNDTAYDYAFTPRFGVVYQPLKTISLFASYANSFTQNTGIDINGNPLKPSFINQYEAGIKTDLYHKLISANVTAYRIVNSNFAQQALLDAKGNQNNNTNVKDMGAEVTSKGVEVDIMTQSIHGFSFIGGYSYNDTRYTKSNDSVLAGTKLRYNPQHTANASIYYAFSEQSPLKGLNAGVSVLYFGERVAGRNTTTKNPTYKLMPVPAYTQLDASVGYSFTKTYLRVRVSNLLNKLSYNIHDDNSINPIAPRQFVATVGWKL